MNTKKDWNDPHLWVHKLDWSALSWPREAVQQRPTHASSLISLHKSNLCAKRHKTTTGEMIDIDSQINLGPLLLSATLLMLSHWNMQTKLQGDCGVPQDAMQGEEGATTAGTTDAWGQHPLGSSRSMPYPLLVVKYDKIWVNAAQQSEKLSVYTHANCVILHLHSSLCCKLWFINIEHIRAFQLEETHQK